MPLSVSWRYIGAYTRQSWEKRCAWYSAIAVCSGSTCRLALAVDWPLTVGETEKQSIFGLLGTAVFSVPVTLPSVSTFDAVRLPSHGLCLAPGKQSHFVLAVAVAG